MLLTSSAARAQPASVAVPKPHGDFGRVIQGAIVEQSFTLLNQRDAPLKVAKVRLTPPLLPRHIPTEIPGQQEAVLKLALDTRTLDGAYEGIVLVSFEDPDVPDARLKVTGQIVPLIEVTPPVLFLTAQRGEKKETSIEIASHERAPVSIQQPTPSSSRLTARLETIETGQRFRLMVELRPDGPAGKDKDVIRLKTSSSAVPELMIPVFTNILERVYTFPDAVEMGTLRFDEIRATPQVLVSAQQTLMVYRKGTSDFEARVSTDLPQLRLTAERGPRGDRYQVTVGLLADKVRPGIIRGHIFVETNDREFAKLIVPVAGEIIASSDRPPRP